MRRNVVAMRPRDERWCIPLHRVVVHARAQASRSVRRAALTPTPCALLAAIQRVLDGQALFWEIQNWLHLLVSSPQVRLRVTLDPVLGAPLPAPSIGRGGSDALGVTQVKK